MERSVEAAIRKRTLAAIFIAANVHFVWGLSSNEMDVGVNENCPNAHFVWDRVSNEIDVGKLQNLLILSLSTICPSIVQSSVSRVAVPSSAICPPIVRDMARGVRGASSLNFSWIFQGPYFARKNFPWRGREWHFWKRIQKAWLAVEATRILWQLNTENVYLNRNLQILRLWTLSNSFHLGR